MGTIEDLKKEIGLIKARNRNVEMDKAWETSLTRKILIVIFTYLAIGFYLYAIGIINPLLNAIVPTIGFLLSTLSFPYFRKLWEQYVYKQMKVK